MRNEASAYEIEPTTQTKLRELGEKLNSLEVHRDTFLGVMLHIQSEEQAEEMLDWLIANLKESQRRMIQMSMIISRKYGNMELTKTQETLFQLLRVCELTEGNIIGIMPELQDEAKAQKLIDWITDNPLASPQEITEKALIIGEEG